MGLINCNYHSVVPALSDPIKFVLKKWIDTNPVANAILHGCEPFSEEVKSRATTAASVQIPSEDHAYNQQPALSFEQFLNECEEDSFDMTEFVVNFRPTSADVERMFSLSEGFQRIFFKIEWRVATTRATFSSIRIVICSSDSIHGILLYFPYILLNGTSKF